jgi:cytochrome P450
MIEGAKRVRPSGPRNLPVLGTLPALYRDLLGWLLELGHGYGAISYTKLGPTPVFLVNDPALIEEVLLGKHRACIKDRQTRQLRSIMGYGLLTSEGEPWKRHRRLAAPPLQPKRIANYATAMVECAERTFAEFGHDGRRDIDRDMSGLTLEIAGKTLLGFDTRADTERVTRILDVAEEHFSKQFHSWHGVLPGWVPTRARTAFEAAVAELDAMIYRVIARCRTEQPPADHLLARLLHARDDDGEALSDKQIRDEAVTMLIAGHETTALSLSYAAYLVAGHPPVGERLREEVDRVLAGRPPGVSDLPALGYVDAVVRETLRLYPPAYVIGRQVIEPFELGGYAVPRGAEVLLSPYSVQRDRRLYDAPERFDPDRWLGSEPGARPRFAYFPFGGGPRVCIGNHFAMLESVLVFAMLMQRFELEPAAGFALRLAPAVTLRPAAGGIAVQVRRRRSAPAARADGGEPVQNM